MYYLAKPLGPRPAGTPIEYVSGFGDDHELYKFKVDGKVRILFRDEWTELEPANDVEV